jgi:hypothetical protein
MISSDSIKFVVVLSQLTVEECLIVGDAAGVKIAGTFLKNRSFAIAAFREITIAQ